MCTGQMHRRPINGVVDPFSTFHLLRTYNRICAPTELSQYYNLAVLKENQEKSVTNSTKSADLISNSEHFKSNQNSSNNSAIPLPSLHRPYNDLSPHLTVSSTCTLSPNSVANNLNLLTNDGQFSDLVQISSTKQSTFYKDLDGSDNLTSSMSYQQYILNRPQRGEKKPIPSEQKDAKYFERRKRNNEAAKKSRDARKMREDRIAFRAAILEQENAILRAQILALRDEMTTLKQLICPRSTTSSIPLNI